MYLYGRANKVCCSCQQVSRYVGRSLVVTVGELRLRLFPSYYFWIQNTTGPQGGVHEQHFLTNKKSVRMGPKYSGNNRLMFKTRFLKGLVFITLE